MIGIYRALLLASFQSASQYRVTMFLYLLFSIIRPVIFLAAWTAVAAARGGTVGGFSAADFAMYYAIVTLVAHLVTSWNAYEFEFEVQHGRLSPKLLRPMHPLHQWIAENLVWKAFTLPVMLPVIVAIAVTFNARFTAEPWQVMLFVPSLLLGAAIQFLWNWIVATAAFWTTRVNAVTTLSDRLGFMFAGLVAPLALLPEPLHTIAYALPFASMIGIPAEILRGGLTPSDVLARLALQGVWLVLCFAGYQAVWRLGLRQYSAVGA
ncbi:MAG: ABC-2 family transporter protein [Chloroflexi bacterium]|nr:ABC-2 family transporter protein [Chloroflexota bacterium]